MNSNFGKKFNFDLGLGFSQTTSLNDQKNKNSSFSSSPYSSAQAKPAWQPKKPSWTHQPPPTVAPSQPTSMVGDIFGKSWSTLAPSSGIAIVEKNPNLFGDLVNSALGQNKSTFFLSRSCRNKRRDGAIGGFAVLGGNGANGNKVAKPKGGGGRRGGGGGGHGDGVPDGDGGGGGDGDGDRR